MPHARLPTHTCTHAHTHILACTQAHAHVKTSPQMHAHGCGQRRRTHLVHALVWVDEQRQTHVALLDVCRAHSGGYSQHSIGVCVSGRVQGGWRFEQAGAIGWNGGSMRCGCGADRRGGQHLGAVSEQEWCFVADIGKVVPQWPMIAPKQIPPQPRHWQKAQCQALVPAWGVEQGPATSLTAP